MATTKAEYQAEIDANKMEIAAHRINKQNLIAINQGFREQRATLKIAIQEGRDAIGEINYEITLLRDENSALRALRDAAPA